LRLVRYGERGDERPGIVAPDGSVRDLSQVVEDIGGAVLSPAGLERLSAVEPDSLPLVAPGVRLGTPFAGTRNFVGIGLNYADHAAETGAAVPAEPIVFLKSLNAIAGPNDDVVVPKGAMKLDWEVELAVVIGTIAKNVDEASALDHVAGYVICNDVSERDWQLERGGSWDKGKGGDGFGPLGPWLVTKDEIPNPHALDMRLSVNGVLMQSGRTETMIFRVAQIVSYVSNYITLYPGDVITTGTPPGVAMGRSPPPYLRSGDVIRVEIQSLGAQFQVVV